MSTDFKPHAWTFDLPGDRSTAKEDSELDRQSHPVEYPEDSGIMCDVYKEDFDDFDYMVEVDVKFDQKSLPITSKKRRSKISYC